MGKALSRVQQLRREASVLVWEVIGNPVDARSLEKLLSLEAHLEELEGLQPIGVEVPAVES